MNTLLPLVLACYMVPKTVTFLSHSYPRGREALHAWLGERAWFVLTDILTDNAWIAMLFTGQLPPATQLEEKAAKLAAFVSFAAMACLMRYALIRWRPSLTPYIATRSFV